MPGNQILYPEDKIPFARLVPMGTQHVVAMFGATVLGPILMGFDPQLALFFTGVGTLIFIFTTRMKVPSYLGPSFAFIGPVLAGRRLAVAGAGWRFGMQLALFFTGAGVPGRQDWLRFANSPSAPAVAVRRDGIQVGIGFVFQRGRGGGHVIGGVLPGGRRSGLGLFRNLGLHGKARIGLV